MWIALSDSFLSIVAHDFDPECLLVRARVAGDIERVFPKAKVERTPDADYLYRAKIPTEQVAQALAREARGIDYRNFKNSVLDQDRHDAYLACWSAMLRLQRIKDECEPAWARSVPVGVLSAAKRQARHQSLAPRTRAGARTGKRAAGARRG